MEHHFSSGGSGVHRRPYRRVCPQEASRQRQSNRRLCGPANALCHSRPRCAKLAPRTNPVGRTRAVVLESRARDPVGWPSSRNVTGFRWDRQREDNIPDYPFQGEEMPMETKRVLLIAGGGLAAIFFQTASARLHAQAQSPSALSGQVTSTEEGPMEGVVVSAKKDGSTINISVITNNGGRFAFPASRLEPGH